MTISAEWLAGFVDGEGCITLYKGKTTPKRKNVRYSPAVILSNTHLPTLLAIQRCFGGGIYPKTVKNTPSNWNQGWSLVWSGANRVRELLEKIRPFVITKKEEVEFMLDVWLPKVHRVTKKGQPRFLTDEQIQERESLASQLSGFKRRNFPQQIIN